MFITYDKGDFSANRGKIGSTNAVNLAADGDTIIVHSVFQREVLQATLGDFGKVVSVVLAGDVDEDVEVVNVSGKLPQEISEMKRERLAEAHQAN